MNDFSGNFSELAQVKVGEVERPKAHPKGHYIFKIVGPMKEYTARSKNKSMRFPLKCQAACDDVDAAALEAAGGLPEKEVQFDFWMSPDARFRFTDFGLAMGASDALNLLELAEWLVENNEPFTLENDPRQSEKDPTIWYDNWDNPAPVE